MAEVLKNAAYQAAHPHEQKRAEQLVARLDALAELENLKGAEILTEDILRVADEVCLTNCLALMPQELLHNLVVVFDKQSAHAQFTNLN